MAAFFIGYMFENNSPVSTVRSKPKCVVENCICDVEEEIN